MYKIQSFNENNIIIPEHIDITGEVDKLLLIIAETEDKVAVMRKYYVKNKAIKYQRDLVSRAMECVVKMDESGITDLMIQIEAEYDRKYGKNKADDKVIL